MAAGNDLLLRGFDDPVDGGGRAFRVLLDAMAHPGRVAAVQGPAEHPADISDAAAAVLLTLCDYATPVWLADALSGPELRAYLNFHTASPLTDDPSRAAFAVLGKGFEPLMPSRFSPGTPDYPDRATTVIIDIGAFGTGDRVRLSGPGINGHVDFAAQGLPLGFWQEMQVNNAAFPLGIDVILTAPGRLCAIPRSTKIEDVTCT